MIFVAKWTGPTHNINSTPLLTLSLSRNQHLWPHRLLSTHPMRPSLRLLLPVTLSLVTLTCALPDPATLFRQPQNPHQVGLVLPPLPSPPYGKSLPPTSYSAGSRTWAWTHWLQDAKTVFRAVFVKQRKPEGSRHVEDDRNVGRFDHDIVLRVNVTSLADTMAIAELAEVTVSWERQV